MNIGALEYRTNKLDQRIQELKINSKGAKPNFFLFWLIFLLGIGVLLGSVLILVAVRIKRKKRLDA